MKTPDRVDVAQRTLGQVFTHPLTWLPFAPIAGAYAFIGVPWWACLPMALVAGGGVVAGWMRRWPVLTERTRTAMLQKFRQEENADLYRRLSRLMGALAHLPTQRLVYTLREAMEIKHAVEARLFADGTITPHEEEVGEMIAELVRTMVAEAEKAPAIQGNVLPKAAAERFDKAAGTLRRVFEDIDVILDPVPESMRAVPGGEDDALSRVSGQLDERLEQARNVRRMLERGLQADRAEVSTDPERGVGQAREPESGKTAEG